jgi:hypothetical protein
MALINSSYFKGYKTIPNLNRIEEQTELCALINLHEPELLKALLGYELFTLFMAAITSPNPEQRYLDILFGKEFTRRDGLKDRWKGLITVTDPAATIYTTVSADNDIVFTVGIGTGNPVQNDTSYVNSDLAGKTYKVFLQYVGWLEILKSDNSNSATAEIRIDSTGGFSWLNGNSFSGGTKYFISLESSVLDISNVPVAPMQDSPIADYVFFYWLKKTYSQVTSSGTVKTTPQNALPVSPRWNAVQSWNKMVDECCLLWEMLVVDPGAYPEYEIYAYNREVVTLLTKINGFF